MERKRKEGRKKTREGGKRGEERGRGTKREEREWMGGGGGQWICFAYTVNNEPKFSCII